MTVLVSLPGNAYSVVEFNYKCTSAIRNKFIALESFARNESDIKSAIILGQSILNPYLAVCNIKLNIIII